MSELKYLVFFGMLFFGVPAMVMFACADRRIERWLFGLLVFTGFITNLTSINFFSFETYRGTSRGLEVTIADLIALALLTVMMLKIPQKLKLMIPGVWIYGLYIVLAAISIDASAMRIYSYCELWKMFRMLLYFFVVFNYLNWRSEVLPVLYAFGCMGMITLTMVLYQKYVRHIYQPPGPFEHQNSMAVYMAMIGPLYLSILLNCRTHGAETWFFIVSFVTISGSCLLTLSRGALFFFPLGCMMTMLGSLIAGGFSWRKAKVIGILGAVGLIGALAMLPSVIKRLESAPTASKDTRINLAIAACNMANDRFFGVGLNNWGVKINPPYTYSEHRTTGRYTDDFKDGIVETIYLLVAAECGWITLGVLLLWFGYYSVQALRLTFACRRDWCFFLPVGMFGGFTANFGQSVLEWVLKQTPNFYELMTMFALTAYVIVIMRKRRSDGRCPLPG